MAKVTMNVYVFSEDGSKSAVLHRGDSVPSWARVTNAAVLDGEPEPAAEPEKAPEPTPAPHPAKKAPAKKSATADE